MSSVPKVFISATSRDLRSYRLALRDALLTGGEVLPVIQEHFPPGYGAVRELLSREIGACEAVICLVGEAFGMAPQDRPERSYTQLEYDLARELQRRYYVFITADGWQPDEPPENSADQEDRQRRHRAAVSGSDDAYTPFVTREELAALGLQLIPHLRRLVAPAPDRPLAAVHSVRAPLADFTGRGEQLGRLLDAVEDSGALICGVRGTGGVGKTALAEKLAWLLADRYPTGRSTSICSAPVTRPSRRPPRCAR